MPVQVELHQFVSRNLSEPTSGLAFPVSLRSPLSLEARVECHVETRAFPLNFAQLKHGSSIGAVQYVDGGTGWVSCSTVALVHTSNFRVR